MTISQVLARAAQLVERGRYDDITAVPMVRAILDAAPRKLYYQAYDTMAAFLGVKYLIDRECTLPETACWLSSAAEYAKVLGL